MKKYIITIIISLLIGFLLSNKLLNEYNTDILNVFNESKNAYLIQQGVYSTEDSMKKNTSSLPSYIYSVIDNMYYVYIGITLDSENVIKLQNYYENKNIDTIIKTTTINDKNIISSLEQYDIFLKNTTDESTIKEIIKQVLEKYKGE